MMGGISGTRHQDMLRTVDNVVMKGGIMKKVFCIGVMAVLLLSAANTPFALKCGDEFWCEKRLTRIGDHSFEVLQSCGEPIMKEVIGYTLTEAGTRELKIENWVYGPKGGCYYILVFEGSILVKISSFRQ
jgi:hypothetical protein